MSVGLRSTRFRFADLAHETLSALGTNRLRSAVSGLAVFVAAAALSIVIVISATIANQVSTDFDALRATSLYVLPTKDIPLDRVVFPPDTAQRLGDIPGVVAGGIVVPSSAVSDNADAQVATTNTDRSAALDAPVFGIDHSVLDATDATIIGTPPDTTFDQAGHVAYIGSALAEQLGVVAPNANNPLGQIVTIDGLAFNVLGIIEDPQRLTDTADAVVIPIRTALQLRDYEPEDFSLLIETQSGAAANVAADVPLVLAPEREDPYVIDVPPDAKAFRRSVEDNIAYLVYAMAALSALVGAISIASAAYSGVVERTGELGLRRAFGAKPRHIRRQIIAETLTIAVTAALAGEIIGLAICLGVSKANDWITIIDPPILAAIPLGAALLGITAAILPARKASRIDPSTALRQI